MARCVDSIRNALTSPLPSGWQLREILVVDNDPAASARPTVDMLIERLRLEESGDHAEGATIRYVVEPIPGIAAARNRALSETTTDVLIFIDDDEIAEEGWPHGLMRTMSETGAAMVGGPVNSAFTSPPPAWISQGRFFDRDDPAHGSDQDWLRSGNLAIDLNQIKPAGLRFDSRYPQGEDTAFSRQARANGLDLRWSSQGAITEYVNADRFDVRWRLRREYLAHRGWTRSSLDLAPTLVSRLMTRLRVTAVAAVRFLTGIGRLGSAAIKLDKAGCVHGLTTLVGVAGKLVEIVSYRPPPGENTAIKSGS